MNFYSWVFDRRLGDYKSPLDFFELGTSFREVAAGGHARSQVVDLPIDTFIGLAEPIPPDDSKRHKNLRKLIENGKLEKFREVPVLYIRKMEDSDDFKVYGHDGRHRALLVKEAGFDTVPVKIVNDTFYFGSDDEAEKYKWPSWLWCQNDKSRERRQYKYVFPIAKRDSGAPYKGNGYNLCASS